MEYFIFIILCILYTAVFILIPFCIIDVLGGKK